MSAHPAKSENLLRVENLAVGYGRRPVLTGVSFSLHSGRFLSLLGPNGAGKTTLLRSMAGLLPVLGGSIHIAGRELGKISQIELARMQAVVLTDRLNPGLLTAHEVVSLGRHPHTGFFGKLGPEDHRAVERALAMVGAEDLAQRYFEQFSDGEKQKVVLARALAQEPRLILLDEPTVHLDLKHRLEVMSILRGLCRQMNIAVVASLHDVDVASRVSDQVALISGGGMSAFGPPEGTLDDRTVAELYNLRGARYDSRLGVMELTNGKHLGPVMVVPGGGAACAALRLLHKRDYGLLVGVAHQGDMDAHVADALGAEVALAPAFGHATAQAMNQCREMLSRAVAVVDSGFPLGPGNVENLELINLALEQGKPVFSLRPESEAGVTWHGLDERVVRCSDEIDLAARLSAHQHRAGDKAQD
ncbi:MAG: ABC transporter ATP-binding protein [Deltaproteobacteria bacterium]|nr:ABC transporter ATP-binding protein [Deltaproteobacteria bacterium]